MTTEPEPIWLTPAAFDKLQREYDHLTTEGRRQIEERIAEARSHGDIRENADYDAAKNEQGLMEARIRKLRHMLDTAEVREASDSGVVEIGSVVTVRDDSGDTEFFVALPENRIPGLMLASPSGPLGRALLGAGVGDIISYEAPAGTFSCEVVAVRPFEG
jgi:transcription elongation factor GreA